jgi:hypothetical protein
MSSKCFITCRWDYCVWIRQARLMDTDIISFPVYAAGVAGRGGPVNPHREGLIPGCLCSGFGIGMAPW